MGQEFGRAMSHAMIEECPLDILEQEDSAGQTLLAVAMEAGDWRLIQQLMLRGANHRHASVLEALQNCYEPVNVVKMLDSLDALANNVRTSQATSQDSEEKLGPSQTSTELG